MRMFRHRAAAALLSTVVASTGLVVLGAAPASAAGPIGYTAVFVEGGCRIATVDIATGATTLLSAPADFETCVNDLAVGPDGSLWGIDRLTTPTTDVEAELVQFDPATGAILDSGLFTGNFTSSGIAEGGLAFGADDVMYAHLVTNEDGCDNAYVCLYTVDPTTRAVTLVGNSDQGETEMFFLTADCAGSMLTSEFTADALDEGAPGPDTLATDNPRAASDPPPGWPDVDAQNGLLSQQLGHVDPSTGEVTRGAEFPELFDLLGLEYDRATGTLYALGLELMPISPDGVFDDISVYTVDPATGDITWVSDFNDEIGFPQGLAIAGSCAAEAPLVVRFTG